MENNNKNIEDLGQHWGAVKADSVLCVIAMRVPSSVDFEKFREMAKSTLTLLGDVKVGNVVRRDNGYYFIQRLTHANRSKVKRDPKEYKIYYPNKRLSHD